MVLLTSLLVFVFFPLLGATTTSGEVHSHPNFVAGVWRMASAAETRNGTFIPDTRGPSPHGLLIFSSSFFFALEINRSDLPLIESNQLPGTPQENAAVVGGTFALSGTYTVDQNGNFASEVVEGCTLPNWIGMYRNTTQLQLSMSSDKNTMFERLDMGDEIITQIVWNKVG
jgi:hypothetical protein